MHYRALVLLTRYHNEIVFSIGKCASLTVLDILFCIRLLSTSFFPVTVRPYWSPMLTALGFKEFGFLFLVLLIPSRTPSAYDLPVTTAFDQAQ